MVGLPSFSKWTVVLTAERCHVTAVQLCDVSDQTRILSSRIREEPESSPCPGRSENTVKHGLGVCDWARNHFVNNWYCAPVVV